MKKGTQTNSLVAAGIALAVGGAAQAQETISMDEWNSMEMQPGWSAKQMINVPVRSSDGEEIGEIENIIVGPEGDVQSLVLEVGGIIFDIGDTHLAVPWDQIDVTGGQGPIEYVTVPVTEDNYDQFDISWSAGDVNTGPREFRVTEMIGDYATLGGETGAGYVNDVIFDEDGKLQAVVVNQSGAMGGGYRAYPYTGYDNGFDPGLDTYDMPYTEDEAGTMQPFDYEPYS